MAQARAAVTAVGAIALATAAMASAQPVAYAATTTCHVGSSLYNKLGPTYVELLRVSRTTCATGLNVIRAYNSCRLKAGGRKGYCHTRVLGFSCTEQRSQGPAQFIARARCTKSPAVVTFTYTENTA